MTTGPQRRCRLSLLAKRNASHRHTSRLAGQASAHVVIVRCFSLLPSFPLSSSHLSHLKMARAVAFFSLSLTQLKRRQTTGRFFCEHSPLLSFSKTRGPVGFAELRSFRLRTAGLAFSRVGFANQNSTASAELSRFFGERNGRKPHRITASRPPDATRDVISARSRFRASFCRSRATEFCDAQNSRAPHRRSGD